MIAPPAIHGHHWPVKYHTAAAATATTTSSRPSCTNCDTTYLGEIWCHVPSSARPRRRGSRIPRYVPSSSSAGAGIGSRDAGKSGAVGATGTAGAASLSRRRRSGGTGAGGAGPAGASFGAAGTGGAAFGSDLGFGSGFWGVWLSLIGIVGAGAHVLGDQRQHDEDSSPDGCGDRLSHRA